MLRYIDVVLIVAAAPVLLLIGVPANGYLIALGAWIVLRAIGVAVERYAAATGEASRQITLRLTYLIARLVALALTVVLVRKGSGRDAGLTALLVIVFAFTVQLISQVATRPRTR